MAEAVQGQEATQPLPDSLNENEAVGILSQVIESQDNPEPEKPRDEKGKFTKKEPEAPTEEAKEAEEEKAEEPEPEQEEEAQPEPRKLKLKYKGEEKEFLEPEVIELAQKGYDYTQKSQQLAKEREEVALKVKSEQEAARKQYEQQLETQRQLVLKLADQEALNANLAQVAMEDPAKALQLQLRRQQIAETYQAVVAEQQKIAQQREAEARESYQKQAKEAVEKLQERIPEWNDDLYRKILGHAVSKYGFQQTEVNAITDHRAIEVLHKARLWDEYQAAKPKTVDKRVAAVPKVQKPGTAEKPNANADRLKDTRAKLDKTGSREAAQEHFLALIEAGRL